MEDKFVSEQKVTEFFELWRRNQDGTWFLHRVFDTREAAYEAVDELNAPNWRLTCVQHSRFTSREPGGWGGR